MPPLAVEDTESRPDVAPPPRRRPWRTVPGAVVLLLCLYALVIALGDPRAASGSDAGGKLATVVVMADRDTVVPDIGYWAAEQDPEGDHHPLWNTSRVGDHWVQATSLPFVVAAVPLYRLAGPFGALVLPMLGGVVAALAARRLSHLLHGGDGWAAFWLVGAAGPALFYAGDFWEHAPALGLALLAVALALEDDRSTVKAVVTGLVAGVAVVLRAEVVVYGAAFAVATLLVAAERRRAIAQWRRIAVTAVAAAVPVLVNAVIERALLSDGVRDGRAADSLAGTATHAGSRVTDAVLTSVGLFTDDRALPLLLGAVLVGALLVVGRHVCAPAQVGERTALLALVVAAGLYAFRFAAGPGFAPGFLVVVPLAAAGVFAARSAKERVVLGTALGALPLVWATAWSGNHLAQWGGRYLLLSGALLTVLAVGAMGRLGWRRPAVVGLVGLTVVTGALGAAWHIERTRTIGEAAEAIEALPDDVVVVSDLGHLGREAGAWYGDHRWLRTTDDEGLDATVAVARDAGTSSLAVVRVVEAGAEEPAAAPLAGYRPVGVVERVPFLVGQHLVVQRYERS